MANTPTFNPTSLHPGAAGAINADGEKLLAEFTSEPFPERPKRPFGSRRQPVATITDADLVGEPMMAWSDWTGRMTGRYFVRDRMEVGLRDDAYTNLRRLTERILRAKPFSFGFSAEFIEEEVFVWCRARLRSETDELLSDHLLVRAAEEFSEHRLIVPIASIEIESPFILGEVLVTTIDPAIFDRGLEAFNAKHPDKREQVTPHFHQLRKEFGGSTAIELTIWGEKRFAKERALSSAFDMAAVLRFLSPAAVSPKLPFPCLPSGCEHIPRTTVITPQIGDLFAIETGVLHHALFNWGLTFEDLDRQMKGGLQNLAPFFETKPLTEHQERVRGALLSYSKGIATYEMSDRLIYAMSAAEHLLLRDTNEPIQQGVGERMAFMIKKEPGARRQVVANFKRAYQLRSRQVHHLAGVEDEEALKAFFEDMYITLFTAISNMGKFKDHSKFLDAIDRIKFT